MRNFQFIRTLSILPAIALAGPVFAQTAPIPLLPGQGGQPIAPAQPARVAPPPAAPVAPALPLPTLSPEQATWIAAWLAGGSDEGLTAAAMQRQTCLLYTSRCV